jgi:hypothetical protein
MLTTPGPPLCAALLALAAGGCASLLPSSRSEVVSGWSSYEEAAQSLARMAPYTATRGDAHQQGLDPATNPAVTVLHFADVLQRFSAAALLQPQDMDRGIRDCLHAGRQCSGYAIAVKKVARQRTGSFWLDSFNFRRETATQGWSVHAFLVFVDDRLVYQLIGGQPTISEFEVQRNPLGPLQSWGDQAVQGVR